MALAILVDEEDIPISPFANQLLDDVAFRTLFIGERQAPAGFVLFVELDAFPDQGEKLSRINGFRQIADRIHPHAFDGFIDRRIGGHQNDRDVGGFVPDGGQHLAATAGWHDHVRDDQ